MASNPVSRNVFSSEGAIRGGVRSGSSGGFSGAGPAFSLHRFWAGVPPTVPPERQA
jgi:hypothetical protein